MTDDSKLLNHENIKPRKILRLIGNVLVILLVVQAIIFDKLISKDSNAFYIFITVVSIWLSFSYYLIIIKSTNKTNIIIWLIFTPIILYSAIKGLI